MAFSRSAWLPRSSTIERRTASIPLAERSRSMLAAGAGARGGGVDRDRHPVQVEQVEQPPAMLGAAGQAVGGGEPVDADQRAIDGARSMASSPTSRRSASVSAPDSAVSACSVTTGSTSVTTVRSWARKRRCDRRERRHRVVADLDALVDPAEHGERVHRRRRQPTHHRPELAEALGVVDPQAAADHEDHRVGLHERRAGAAVERQHVVGQLHVVATRCQTRRVDQRHVLEDLVRQEHVDASDVEVVEVADRHRQASVGAQLHGSRVPSGPTTSTRSGTPCWNQQA